MQARVAIIGGSGIDEIIEDGKEKILSTPYGPPSPISVGNIEKKSAVFLRRHGKKHEYPPHKVNYQANIYALKSLGVERILATNAVGAINQDLSPGDIVVLSDVIDYTKTRPGTFYDSAPVTHVDVSEPFCPTERSLLMKAIKAHGRRVSAKIVLAGTEGPRYETPSEIKMMRGAGCDVVGMTTIPEVFLARELEICYACVAFISNMAAGIQKRLTVDEVINVGNKVTPELRTIIGETVQALPSERQCPCGAALQEARL